MLCVRTKNCSCPNIKRGTMRTSTKAPSSKIARCYLMLCVLLAIPTATFAQAKVDETVLKNLQWRSIGPANMGGRIDDIAVVESNTNVFYVGAATGGVRSEERRVGKECRCGRLEYGYKEKKTLYEI